MRRLIAFISLAITMLVLAVAGVPSLTSKITAGTEFEGGYDILYKVTNSDGVSYKGNALKTVMDKATKTVNDRLNAMDISYPQVSVEDEEYIRITVPADNDSELDHIRHALASNGKITVRDSSDKLLFNGDDVFKSVTLSYINDTPYIQVKVSDYDKLKEVTSELEAMNTGEEADAPVMVIWLGYEELYTDSVAEDVGFEGDSYANIENNTYSQWKILSMMSITAVIEEDFSVQGNFTQTNMNVLNSILSSDSFNFVLTEEYCSAHGSMLGENGPRNAIIAMGIGLAVIAILMIIAYHFVGILSILSIALYAIVVLVSYNSIGGVFGTETIVALTMGIGLAVNANVVFLERIKDEIRKGKEISRAYTEGSKKSVSTILDSTVLVMVAALVLYLLGNQVVKSFSAVMIISEVAIIVIIVLITRLMLNLICNSTVFKNKPGWFGVKKEDILDVNDMNAVEEHHIFSKTNFIAPAKKIFTISGAVVLVGVIVGLIFQFASNKFFNYSSQMDAGTRIYFQTVDPQFGTEDGVVKFFSSTDYAGRDPDEVTIGEEYITFADDDFVTYRDVFTRYGLNVDEVSHNRVTVYNVTISYYKDLDTISQDAIANYFEAEEDAFYDEDNDIDIMRVNFAIANYTPYSGGMTALNALTAFVIMLVVVAVYLAIRFNWSYAISGVATLLLNGLIMLAILAITRSTFSIEAIAAVLGMVIYSINSIVVTFDKLRESISESKEIWTKETRTAYFNKALQDTMYGQAFTIISTLVVIIALFAACGSNLYPLNIALFIGAIVSTFGAYFVIPHIWVYLDGAFAARKAIRKANKKPRVKDKNEVEEYIFYGINN